MSKNLQQDLLFRTVNVFRNFLSLDSSESPQKIYSLARLFHVGDEANRIDFVRLLRTCNLD